MNIMEATNILKTPPSFEMMDAIEDNWERLLKVLETMSEYKHENGQKQIEAYAKHLDKMNAEKENKRINCYTCASGHDTVTIDIDHGTTPMFLGCKTCGKQATSHMYRCNQTLTPAWEWYAPNPADCAEYELDHVLQGGLLLREYQGSEVGECTDSRRLQLSQEQMKTLYKFQKEFKQKNPGFTQRQFKRAFLKKFPNLLSNE